MDIIFASHNENKVQEIRTMMPKDMKLLSLNGIYADLVAQQDLSVNNS